MAAAAGVLPPPHHARSCLAASTSSVRLCPRTGGPLRAALVSSPSTHRAMPEPSAGAAAARTLLSVLVHEQMRMALQRTVASLTIGGHAAQQIPRPRLAQAGVATCFQIQAQARAQAMNVSPDSMPYNSDMRGPHAIRFIPTPDAKGGCITLPVFNADPRAYLDELLFR